MKLLLTYTFVMYVLYTYNYLISSVKVSLNDQKKMHLIFCDCYPFSYALSNTHESFLVDIPPSRSLCPANRLGVEITQTKTFRVKAA
jgi:hypothetical protein